MSADVAGSHGGDGGGEDEPPTPNIRSGCFAVFRNKGKGKRKENLGGRAAGRKTRGISRCIDLLEEVGQHGPVPIDFEEKSHRPRGTHAQHLSNYIGDCIRRLVPLYYPSWADVPDEIETLVWANIENQFNLTPHKSDPGRWKEIRGGINQMLTKSYNSRKNTLKTKHWVRDIDTGRVDIGRVRSERPEEITSEDWEKQIALWSNPDYEKRCQTNSQNRSKQKTPSRQGSRSLARLRDQVTQAAIEADVPPPTVIDHFFIAHTDQDGNFPCDADRVMYEEMLAMKAEGKYTDDEINRIVRGGKQRGHMPGVGQIVPRRSTHYIPPPPPVDPRLEQASQVFNFLRSDDRFADAFGAFLSGGASGSGTGGSGSGAGGSGNG